MCPIELFFWYMYESPKMWTDVRAPRNMELMKFDRIWRV